MTKPRKFSTFNRSEGSYNFLQPREIQASYRFFLPDGVVFTDEIKLHYVLPIEKDRDLNLDPNEMTALEAAIELRDALNSAYLFSDQKKDIVRLIEFLEARSRVDRIEFLKYRIDKDLDRSSKLLMKIKVFAEELQELESDVTVS
jgi:hypothetical protein